MAFSIPVFSAYEMDPWAGNSTKFYVWLWFYLIVQIAKNLVAILRLSTNKKIKSKNGLVLISF